MRLRYVSVPQSYQTLTQRRIPVEKLRYKWTNLVRLVISYIYSKLNTK